MTMEIKICYAQKLKTNMLHNIMILYIIFIHLNIFYILSAKSIGIP